MNLTEHFTFEELTRTDIADLQGKNRRQAETLKGKLIRLAEWAEEIRAALGNAPMIVTSGYRCGKLNERVGGSPTSQHTKAEAIDFRPAGIEPEQAFKMIAASSVSFGQLILEKRGGRPFLHVGMGARRQLLYSPKAGVYEAYSPHPAPAPARGEG